MVRLNRQNWYVLSTRVSFTDRKSSPFAIARRPRQLPFNGRFCATAGMILAAGSLLEGKLAITIPGDDSGLSWLHSPPQIGQSKLSHKWC